MSKTKVLFVCLGNICRSPAAEAILQNKVNQRALQDLFDIDSAGTSGHHKGELADSRMRAKAIKRQINITSVSRKFVSKDFNSFDYIVVMDDENYANVTSLDPNGLHRSKIRKMTEFCSARYSGFDKVPDPYYGGEDGFELVLDLLDDACDGLLAQICD